MAAKGVVFNIQHFSVHDGPGIRTVVFLKGCPLRCRWCGNPESQQAAPQTAWTRDQCIGCGSCALRLGGRTAGWEDGETGYTELDLTEAEAARICPSQALHVIGRQWEAAAVMEEVMEDQVFYRHSGGGLTLSGGEPLVQPAFSLELLNRAKAEGIPTAIETTGFGAWADLRALAEKLDFIFYDIKTLDDGVHREQTGVSNRLILENFRRLAAAFPDKKIRVRTPVIPGFNDSTAAIGAIRDWLDAFPQVEYELLKYHRYGVGKYATLGREYPMPAEAVIEDGQMAVFNRLARRRPAPEGRIGLERGTEQKENRIGI